MVPPRLRGVDRPHAGRVVLYEGEPAKELINLWVQSSSFKIPAGAADHVVKASFTFPQDAMVYGMLPHMHYRGKQFTYTATFPDGRSETLLHVPAYDFNWQTVYELENPLSVPKGTRIDCEARYDNSTANPVNPDPTKDVTFGNAIGTLDVSGTVAGDAISSDEARVHRAPGRRLRPEGLRSKPLPPRGAFAIPG
ncbi:MAG TPA: hypothetical protein VNB06_17855 [Thermoanaerobaculia bacterium]|nr:hypothetical protein [Thermoanaerobaculia bacterium]